jgi:hypothetical protein
VALPPSRRSVTTEPNDSLTSRPSGRSSVISPPTHTIGGWLAPRSPPEEDGMGGSGEGEEWAEGDSVGDGLGEVVDGLGGLEHAARKTAMRSTCATAVDRFA